ncbi:melatonin receptor type 1B-B-like [Lytechinus pictus]|uniref:melatonin receptor type 1B-B-like n=1 Tax=Lytechinus pictus TaxID=7653 RepID=UPI0030B9E450
MENNYTEEVSTDMINLVTMTGIPMSTMNSTMTPEGGGQGWGVGRIENNIAVRTVYGIIAMTGILGNFLVCFALFRNTTLRTRTSYFIIHLAFTDLLTSTWTIPFHLFPDPPGVADNTNGEIVCRLYISKFPLWCTIFASVYSLVNVTLERYFAVVHPVKYKIFFSRKWSALMMAATWVIGFLSNIYFFWLYDAKEGSCDFVGYPSVAAQRIVGVYTFAVVYVIPIVATLFCHHKMIASLKKQLEILRQERREKRATGQKPKKDANAWQLKAAHEIQKTLLVVIITYMICWAPNQFIFFAFNMGAPVDFTQPYYHVSVVFALFNSCLNPFIYVYKNKYFRRGLLESLGCPEGMLTFLNRIGPASTGTAEGDTPTNTLENTAGAGVSGRASGHSTNDSLV